MNKQGFILVAIFLLAILVVPLSEAKETRSKIQSSWCNPLKASFSPSDVYRGEPTTFSSTLTNGIAASLDVKSYGLRLGWESSYRNIGSGSIAGGASQTFSFSVTIPQITTGPYKVYADVYGQSVGDWWAEHCTWEWTQPINVNERPPLTVSVQANPTTGPSPLTVSFSASVSGGTPGYSYSWTFGDGGTSTSQSPTHTYSATGSFTAKVVVQDQMGRQQSDSISIQVSTPPPFGGGTSDPGTMSGLLIIGIIVLVVVVAIVIIFLLSKKKKETPPPIISEPTYIQQYSAPAPPPPPPPQYTPPPQYPPPPPPPISPQKDDGTTLIERLKERQGQDKGKTEKFDAYKPTVVSGQNITNANQAKNE